MTPSPFQGRGEPLSFLSKRGWSTNEAIGAYGRANQRGFLVSSLCPHATPPAIHLTILPPNWRRPVPTAALPDTVLTPSAALNLAGTLILLTRASVGSTDVYQEAIAYFF